MTRLVDDADFVVIGTGAGGATAARVLSAAGHSVIMVEEGPSLGKQARARGLLDAMSQSVRDFATVATEGIAPIPLLQGRCVGGSTAINSGIIWRTPADVRLAWRRDYGLDDLVGPGLDRAFDVIEEELGVATVESSVMGGNGHLMAHAADLLGLPGRPMRRNVPGCRGRARCLQGCPEGARQSMDVAYVPRALESGARLHTLCRARRVLFRGSRATGVEGVALDACTRKPIGKFRFSAHRAVILAAGAIHTPLLLLQSGLRRNVGDGFQAHPGVAVLGRFREQVGMGYGASQAYEVPLRDRDMKLESISLPPELLATRIPGAGATWQQNLARLNHFAQWCAIIRMETRGRVRRGLFGGPRVHYRPTHRDVERLKQAASLLARMLLTAGAEEVYPGISGVRSVMTEAAQADEILAAPLRQRDFHLMASHHFASAKASNDARHGVVAPDLGVHGAQGLYVMDASALPSNMGVNPQHTIMGVVMQAAERLAS
ncbi:MAG: GMC family oxidoreductase [Myxococcales bacterium]|nr:GMC family oxidoreductase [Myxococcales bacterium]MDD9969889.1 GMC family oxidoreductase [Myxococcales bacterium]